MQDRNVQYPNRYKLTPVGGTTDIYDLTPVPGTVAAEGTPINKASLLKDATAALYGLGANAVPDDVLKKLKTLVDAAQGTADGKVPAQIGYYTGNGGSSASSKNSLDFGFRPKAVIAFNLVIGNNNNANIIPMVSDSTDALSFSRGGSYGVVVSWLENGVSWYCASGAFAQLSEISKKYGYIAIG